ncbi:MAG: 50S ribosomal protein L11 methyltransferase [Gammaproteobacteria bacterium]|nr:50S ribosomal protein L11 methyltransferase [Gammaproteobacteria bacterium]
MTWLQVKVQTLSDIAEDLSTLLTDIGALAVTLQDAGDQPLYEPSPELNPIWDDIIITGLFEPDVSEHYILLTLTSKYPALKPEIHVLEDQEWERAWMQDFKPMQFGKRLWILPSYQSESFSPHQVILDPGLAFGTGKHPTTALCLQWLDKNIFDQEIIIDYGCGSGILAIAAIKLGAKKVYAIDHDPQAIIATNENAKQNGISNEQIVALLPKEFHLLAQANILIANILANPLIDLAETFATLLAPQGRIVLSGILEEQTASIIEAYQAWFTIVGIEQEAEWMRIEGAKN